MSETVYWLLSFTVVMVEAILCGFLASAFFTRSYHGWKYVLLISFLGIVNCLIMYFIQNNLWLRIILIIIMTALWVKVTCKARVIKCLLLSLAWIFYITIVDSSVMMLGYNVDGIGLPTRYFYWILCLTAKIVELFGVIILSAWLKQRFLHQAGGWMAWLHICAIPFVTLIAAFFLARFTEGSPTSEEDLVFAIILLVVDIFSILLLYRIEAQQAVLRDNIVLRQNLKLESDHITSLQNTYATQRKQTHDFQNELVVLQGLASRNASQEEFQQYLESILATKFSQLLYVNTHRMVVDVIICQKEPWAKSKNIDFQYQLDDLSSFPLPDDALVVVLTNLIDNAIEACELVLDTANRYIKLKMKMTDYEGLLRIENSTMGTVTIKDNQISTTKKDAWAHGYGLKNVASILDQHGATYVLDYQPDEKVFSFTAQFPRSG